MRDEQRQRGFVRILASAANTEPSFGVEPPAAEFADEDRFRLATEAALWERTEAAGGVFLGRVAAVIFADHPRAFQLRLLASPQTRLRRLNDYGGLDEATAKQALANLDRSHGEYARHLYEVDLDDPTIYDAVLTTDRTNLDSAADAIIGLLGANNLVDAMTSAPSPGVRWSIHGTARMDRDAAPASTCHGDLESVEVSTSAQNGVQVEKACGSTGLPPGPAHDA
jgi:cytidylate kinase